MKTLFKFLIFSIVVSLAACQQSDDSVKPRTGEGEVSFSFAIVDEQITGARAANARVATDLVPSKIVISVKNSSGEYMYTLEELDVIAFDDNYISQPISLLVGDYELVDYFVKDAAGDIIYVTPLDGSDLAYLVEDPLSIGFSIAKDDSKQIVPEVISTQGVEAADFGYTDFSFDIVETFDFLMSVHFFDEVSASYELTSADVQILGDGVVVYSKPIADATDQIRIRDGYTEYTVITSKSGFVSDTVTLSNSELKERLTDPLMVIISQIDKQEVLGPEQTLRSTCSGGIGQSFTASSTSYLSAITVSGCYNWAMLTLNIYEGEGMKGTLLHSQEVHLASPAVYKFELSHPVSMTSGHVYTFEFVGAGYTAWLSSGNPYAEGQGYINGVVNSDIDWWFKTYVY